MADFDPLKTQRDLGSDVVTELRTVGLTDPEEIGRGGFGVVYRCIRRRLDRTVAVKHGDEVHERDVPEDAGYALEHPTLAVLILVLMTKLRVPEKAQRRSVEYGGLRHWSEMGTQRFPCIEADDLPNDAADAH